MSNGLFIVFEGIDGSGKTTQIELLRDHLRNLSIEPLLVREPGGTDIGEQVREILLSHKSTGMHPITEMLLFCSARAQLVTEQILPALAQGRVVIADRYRISTEIYQGVGRGLPIAAVNATLDFATQQLLPDLCFILDIAPEIGYTRRMRNNPTADRMESAGSTFFQRIAAAFADYRQEYVRHIDGESSQKEIADTIWQEITKSQWWQSKSTSH
ncbi:MAG: dTMP kinase [bacterium]|nr:dTMP kinase [bacterium]